MNTTTNQIEVQNEDFDYENALKNAFFVLREIPDRNNKLEAMKDHLLKFIEQAQDGKFDVFEGGY